MQNLIALVYISSEVRPFTHDELEQLLSGSRVNNVKERLTGMLLYKEGNFMQLLEGPHDAVIRTFEKIERDPRHTNVTTLLNVRLQHRNFEHWSMGFEHLDPISEGLAPNFNPIWDKPFTWDYFGTNPHNALRLLLNFRKKKSAPLATLQAR